MLESINKKKINKILQLLFLITIFLLLNSCGTTKYQKINNTKEETIFSQYDPHNIKYHGHYKIGKKYKIRNKTYFPKSINKLFQTGVASWYGKTDHGKHTANGDIFNKYSLTAAHPTLPLPSIIEVQNLSNNKKLILLVNDRGPFAKNRILDISEYAAKTLDFQRKGTTQVRVKYLKEETEKFLNDIGMKQIEGYRVKHAHYSNLKYSINAKIILLNLKLLSNLKDLNRNYLYASLS